MRRRRDVESAEVALLQAAHTPSVVRRRLGDKPAPSYLQDFIYGAIDGAVTTVAVVAGVEGASLDEKVVIILGGANLIADGFSMAVSNFLGSRAERQRRERARREEQLHIRVLPEGSGRRPRTRGRGHHLRPRRMGSDDDERGAWLRSDYTNEYRAAAATLIAFLAVGFRTG